MRGRRIMAKDVLDVSNTRGRTFLPVRKSPSLDVSRKVVYVDTYS